VISVVGWGVREEFPGLRIETWGTHRFSSVRLGVAGAPYPTYDFACKFPEINDL